MSGLKPTEELIEQEPDFSPEEMPGDLPEESLMSRAAPEDEENVERTLIPSTYSADEWQEAVDAITDDEPGLRVETEEDIALDESTMDTGLIDDAASDNEETGTEKIRIIASDETVSFATESPEIPTADSVEAEEVITATRDELKPAIEAILFVADEPLPFKQLCKVLGDVKEEDVQAALNELVGEYDSRQSGLEFREIAGGWRISTRPQNHEFIRKYLKSRPTARLSLPALETLAVIAYKQPITVPEILEIRGVTSSSAIKTLLEKRLIVTKGRKETVGRPMMYGTSKEFLIQFGLKDLTELPSIEDFQDLAQ